MKNITVLVLCAMLLSGCATGKFNYSPEVVKFSIPPLGDIRTIGLGEDLLDQGVKTDREIIQIHKKGSLHIHEIRPGKLIKTGDDDEYNYYAQEYGKPIFFDGIFSMPLPHQFKIKKASGELCSFAPLTATLCTKKIVFEKKIESSISESDYRKTLLYSGRIGNKLRISYREFSGNIARPAFSNEIEYDLNESNVIGYKGAKIEIISASNTGITYKVLHNFNSQD